MKVHFVCEGNMIRSQMAETFYNAMTDSDDATSSGAMATLAGDGVGEREEKLMNEIGYTMAGKRAKQLTPEMLEAADKVVLFPTSYMPEYALDSPKSEHWDVADPYYSDNRTDDMDRSVRDSIYQMVKELISREGKSHE